VDWDNISSKVGQTVAPVWLEYMKHLLLLTKDPFQPSFNPSKHVGYNQKKDTPGTSGNRTTQQNGQIMMLQGY